MLSARGTEDTLATTRNDRLLPANPAVPKAFPQKPATTRRPHCPLSQQSRHSGKPKVISSSRTPDFKDSEKPSTAGHRSVTAVYPFDLAMLQTYTYAGPVHLPMLCKLVHRTPMLPFSVSESAPLSLCRYFFLHFFRSVRCSGRPATVRPSFGMVCQVGCVFLSSRPRVARAFNDASQHEIIWKSRALGRLRTEAPERSFPQPAHLGEHSPSQKRIPPPPTWQHRELATVIITLLPRRRRASSAHPCTRTRTVLHCLGATANS